MSLQLDLGELGGGLHKDAAGIWRSKNDTAEALSFPEDGHGACFQIEDASFWFAHRSECIATALRRFPFDGPLLDVGGGNGAVSSALEKRGIDTVLLEPGPSGAQNARRRGLGNVVCSTLADARFRNETFGAAGLFDVVEHVAEDEALLREVHRILRPSGVLCVTVPAYDWLWSAEDEHAGHHRRYTLARLRAVLERCGFQVRYETYFFAPLTAPVWMFRSLPHLLRRRRPADIEEAAAAQHLPSPLVRRVTDAILGPEIRRIRSGRTVPFGTSCLAIAVK